MTANYAIDVSMWLYPIVDGKPLETATPEHVELSSVITYKVRQLQRTIDITHLDGTAFVERRVRMDTIARVQVYQKITEG